MVYAFNSSKCRRLQLGLTRIHTQAQPDVHQSCYRLNSSYGKDRPAHQHYASHFTHSSSLLPLPLLPPPSPGTSTHTITHNTLSTNPLVPITSPSLPPPPTHTLHPPPPSCSSTNTTTNSTISTNPPAPLTTSTVTTTPASITTTQELDELDQENISNLLELSSSDATSPYTLPDEDIDDSLLLEIEETDTSNPHSNIPPPTIIPIIPTTTTSNPDLTLLSSQTAHVQPLFQQNVNLIKARNYHLSQTTILKECIARKNKTKGLLSTCPTSLPLPSNYITDWHTSLHNSGLKLTQIALEYHQQCLFESSSDLIVHSNTTARQINNLHQSLEHMALAQETGTAPLTPRPKRRSTLSNNQKPSKKPKPNPNPPHPCAPNPQLPVLCP